MRRDRVKFAVQHSGKFIMSLKMLLLATYYQSAPMTPDPDIQFKWDFRLKIVGKIQLDRPQLKQANQSGRAPR